MAVRYKVKMDRNGGAFASERFGNILSREVTDREMEILRLIAEGAGNAKIAEFLGISEGTVKTHVRNLLRKTGFSSRKDLVKYFPETDFDRFGQKTV